MNNNGDLVVCVNHVCVDFLYLFSPLHACSEKVEAADLTAVHRRINTLESHMEAHQQQLSTIQGLLENITSAGIGGGNRAVVNANVYDSSPMHHTPVYQYQPLTATTTGTFVMQAPPPPQMHLAETVLPSQPVHIGAAISGLGTSLGGVPLSPTTRRLGIRGFTSATSPQIEIEDIPGDSE